MLETPATTKNKVSGDEHRDATNTALHAGAAPDPACLKGNRSVMVSGDGTRGHYLRIMQVISAWAMGLSFKEFT